MEEANRNAKILTDLVFPDDIKIFSDIQIFLSSIDYANYDDVLRQTLYYQEAIGFDELVSNIFNIAGKFSAHFPTAVKLLTDLCQNAGRKITQKQLVYMYPDFSNLLDQANLLTDEARKALKDQKYEKETMVKEEIIKNIMIDNKEKVEKLITTNNIDINEQVNYQYYFQISTLAGKDKLSYFAISVLFDSFQCYEFFMNRKAILKYSDLELALIGKSEKVLYRHLFCNDYAPYISVAINYHNYDMFDWICQNYKVSVIPFETIIQMNNLSITFFCLSKRYKVYINEKEMDLAFQNHCTETIRAFLHFKRAVSSDLRRKFFYLALKGSTIDMVRLLYEDGYCYDTYEGYSALHYALQNSVDVVDFVIQKIGDRFVNKSTWSTDYPLFIAADFNNIDLIKYLIDKGANVNIKRKDSILLHAVSMESYIYFLSLKPSLKSTNIKLNPFFSVVQNKLKFVPNNDLIIKALIENGANINQKVNGTTALITAVNMNAPNDLLEALINYGANPRIMDKSGFNALHYASQKNSLASVSLLIQNGADPNTKSSQNTYPIMLTTDNMITMLLLRNGARTDFYYQGKQYLNYLFDEKKYDNIILLVKNGANPNIVYNKKRKSTLLSEAMKIRNYQLVEAIVASPHFPADDASPLFLVLKQRQYCSEELVFIRSILGVRKDWVNATNHKGRTPLFYTIRRTGFVHDTVKELLNQDANIDHQDKNGMTPLMRAISKKCNVSTDLFLRKGADPNIKDAMGKTALHHAASKSFMCDELISFNADINTLDNNGMFPCEYAWWSSTKELLRPPSFEFPSMCNDVIWKYTKKVLHWTYSYIFWTKKNGDSKDEK